MKSTFWLGIGCLFAAASLCPLHAAERASLDHSLRFGYALEDGAVAIDPAVIYVYCPATDTLVVHPEYLKDAAAELAAEVLPTGEWFIPGGKLITPQTAKLMIVTASSEKAAIRNLGALTAVSLDRVALAVALPTEPGEPTPVCQTKLTGYKCKNFDCSGCSGGIQKTGGALTYCDKSDNPQDTCTQTGSFKTCIITTFTNADCTGSVLQSTTANYNSCQ